MAIIPTLPMTGTQLRTALVDINTELAGKAASSAILTTEQLQDAIAAMLQAGTHTGLSVSYNDTDGTIDLTVSGGGGASVSEEQVEDWVGGLVTQGTGISVTYDDTGNVLRIALTGESFTTALKTKLDGIAAGATANDIKFFATYADALAYSTANPTAVVFSEQVAP